jgi:hypothetical protein
MTTRLVTLSERGKGARKESGADQLVSRVQFAILVLGAAFRLWQYFASGSLFIDELAIAHNIVGRPLWTLLATPLADDQSAPRGFLLVEKLLVTAFGPGDLVLRAFPLLCAQASLPLFRRLASRVVGPVGSTLALALFATSMPLIYAGAELKQYSTDVVVAIALTLLALHLHSNPPRTRAHIAAAAAAGVVAAWFSQPAVLVLAGVGAALLWLSRRERAVLRPLGIIGIVWAVGSLGATATALAVLAPDTRDYLHRFWAHGFPPPSPRAWLASFWPIDRLHDLFVLSNDRDPVSHAYPAPWLYLIMMLVGVVVLLRRARGPALVVIAPVAATLLAALAGQYPFADRLIDFLLPALFLVIVAGAEWVGGWLATGPVRGAVAALLVAPALTPIVRFPPPWSTEDVRPLMEYLRTHRKPADGIYVYYGARQAMQFYAPLVGIPPDAYQVGACSRGESRRYLAQIDAFRSRRRVWILIGHALTRFGERDVIVSYLDSIGTRLAYTSTAPRGPITLSAPTELLLYDLANSARLERARSADFPIPEIHVSTLRLGCEHGPQANPRPAQ